MAVWRFGGSGESGGARGAPVLLARPCLWEILYFLPDRPNLLAPPMVIERDDLPPRFPELRRFLAFWRESIEASIAAVTVVDRGGTVWRPIRAPGIELPGG